MAKNVLSWVVAVTFELWPPKCYQFILECSNLQVQYHSQYQVQFTFSPSIRGNNPDAMSNITFNYFSIYYIYLFSLSFFYCSLLTFPYSFIFMILYQALMAALTSFHSTFYFESIWVFMYFIFMLLYLITFSGTTISIGMKEVLSLLCQYLRKFPKPVLEISRWQDGTSGFKFYCPLVFSVLCDLTVHGWFWHLFYHNFIRCFIALSFIRLEWQTPFGENKAKLNYQVSDKSWHG